MIEGDTTSFFEVLKVFVAVQVVGLGLGLGLEFLGGGLVFRISLLTTEGFSTT